MPTTASSYTIIRAGSADVNRLLPLFQGYLAFYKLEHAEVKLRAYLHARLSAEEAVVFLALNKSNEAIGFVLLYPTFSSLSLKPALILNDLFVLPKYRRGGAGRMLMQRAIDYARDTGAKGLSLETAVDNANARQLYQQLGFGQNEQFCRYELIVEDVDAE